MVLLVEVVVVGIYFVVSNLICKAFVDKTKCVRVTSEEVIEKVE
jgi:hypothetical protein